MALSLCTEVPTLNLAIQEEASSCNSVVGFSGSVGDHANLRRPTGSNEDGAVLGEAQDHLQADAD